MFLVSADSVELQAVEGNPHRAIWKICCWRMAEEVKQHKNYKSFVPQPERKIQMKTML